MAEKVTEMLLKVPHLECSKCYKKVKKILCKFPQIQDQVYDEKKNTVRIKVVSCSPEKIRDKICCKGKGTITCIEIVIPKEKEKPKPPPPPPPPPTPPPPSPPKPVHCSCGCGGHRSNCGRPVCSCGCGGYGGICVRLVYCSCGCGGYKGNCGSRCIEYYVIEDNSQGCTIL